MEVESVLIALGLVVVLGIGYKLLRRRAAAKDSASEQFFGGAGEETVLTEMRGNPPSELPPVERPEPGRRAR